MKTVIYVGKAGLLGRHGNVKPGDTIELRELEYQSAMRNSPEDFELQPRMVPAKSEDQEAKIPEVPTDTEEYALTTIDWDSPNLCKWLESRERKQLLKIAQGMGSLGLSISVHNRTPKSVSIEAIHEAAEEAGWISK